MRVAATDIIDAMQGMLVALIPKLGSGEQDKLLQRSTSDGGGGASAF